MTVHAESVQVHAGWTRLTGPRAIGILGIALGAVAFWLALPPLHARALYAPIAVGILAVAAGIWAASRQERRVGWGAVAIGIVGIVGGILATRSSVSHLEVVVAWSALLSATLRSATPLTFAAIGGLFSERSGVVNIGLEGMMLMGAFFGVWGADRTNSWIGGLVIAMAAGGALALVHAFFSIHLRADQIVGGTAINFLALGITGYMYNKIYGDRGTPTNLTGIPDVHLHFLSHIPDVHVGRLEFGGSFLAQALGQLNLMVWLSIALLFVAYVVVFKTPLGLRIRSVGEHPRAADTVGISVYGMRYGAVVISGVFAALGGAYLSLGFVHSFTENMIAGRGFIALAALIFGGWRPFGAYGAALLFGFSSALALRLPDAYGSSAGTLFQALPYVLTLIAVAGVIGRSIPPAAIGRPYKKQ
jgi:general nucleoside transport system permease protein